MDDRGETAQTVGIRRPEGVDGLADVFDDYVAGKNTGRTLVKIADE